MISMIEHIEYLMLNHDCVVVPGFGAFIAQYNNSNIPSENEELFCSPKRNISFNASINHNDGLLANSIAKKYAISYAEALSLVEQNTTVFKQSLAEGSEIPVGRLGYFFSNSEGNIEFFPFIHPFTVNDYFGLQAFHFPTLEELSASAEEVTPPYIQPLFTEEDAPKPSSKWWGRKVLQYAASIVVLLALTFALSTPIVVDAPSSQLATMNIPTPKAPQKVAKPQKKATMAAQPKVGAKQVAAAIENQGQYAIVICTLSSEKQVAEFFQWHKDLSPSNVVKHNKNFLIFYKRGNDKNQLLKEAKAMPKQYSSYWITKV
ncbi:MAG: hypothetical protein ACI30R_06160 [Sodaliphilus sp.]